MGGEAMAFEAIAVERHGIIHDSIHCSSVAADAVILHDAAGFFLCPDGIRDLAESESSDVVIARNGFDVIFREECMGGVAVGTGRPFPVWSMEPALVDRVHYVAVIAGPRVVAQVSSEIGHIHAYTEGAEQCGDRDQGR